MSLLLIWAARHWLAILTSLVTFYVGLSFLAPVSMYRGWEKLADQIYFLYSFTCHQLPASSFWILGAEYPFKADLTGLPNLPVNAFSQAFVGTAEVGFKSGICWRTLAIYASLPVFLLIYRGTSRNWKVLPLWIGLLFVVPMAADGLSQVAGLRESNLFLRLLTGGMFSLGLTLALVPRVDLAMKEVAASLQSH